MADTRYQQDISAMFAGALNVGAEIGLRNLLQRRAREEEALTAVATIMSNNGTLDALPTDVWKKMESRLGKDLGNLLMYRSGQRKKQLASKRTIEQGVKDLINRPVSELVPMQNQRFELPLPSEAGPEGDIELEDITQRFGTRRVPTGGSAIPVENYEQLQQLAAQNPQVAQALQQYDVRQRQPTNAERFLRADQLSPFGAALLTDSIELGTLAGTGQTLQVRRAELEYKRSKLAMDKQKPTFGSVTDIVRPDGTVIKAWPMWTPDGGVQYMELAEGPQRDSYTRIIQQIQKVQDQLAKPNLTPVQEERFNKQLDKLNKAFGKLISTKGGVTINAQPPMPLQDKSGNIIGWVYPGEKTTQRQLGEMFNLIQTGGKARIEENQGILSSGNLGLKTLQRLRQFMSPTNVGRLGQLKRLGIGALSNVQGLPELVQELRRTNQTLQPMLMEKLASEKPGFEARLRRSLNSANAYDATLNAFAAIIAKFRDPQSTIREEEFNRIRNEVAGMDYPSAVSRLSALETELRTKMQQAENEMKYAEDALRRGLGSDVFDSEVGLPDVAYRRILIPDRILPELAGATLQTPLGTQTPQGTTTPPQGTPQGAQQPQQPQPQQPFNAMQFMAEAAIEYGVDVQSLLPGEWKELASLVNNSLAANRGLTVEQQRGAIRLIVRHYLQQRGISVPAPGGQ